MKTATLGQTRKILELLEEVPQEQVQAVLGSGLLSDLFRANVSKIDREQFRRVCGLSSALLTFHITVYYYPTYQYTLAKMIRQGKYDRVNNDIVEEHFPINKPKGINSEDVNMVLFHFEKSTTPNEVIIEMDKMGYRPATLPELLALGASEVRLQQQFPIVALGSVWQRPMSDLSNERLVPWLGWGCMGRILDLARFEYGWNEKCRFAAVRKAA